MGRNGLVEIIRLRITPTANRNSCRVARLVGVDTQGSVLRPQPWAVESQLRQSCCCLRSGQLGVLPIVYCACEGDEINTKSRGGGWRLRLGGDVGADRRKTSFPPCRLHHPHRHAVHDAIRRNGKKKRPPTVQKVRLSPVQKQLRIEAPPQPSPKDGSSFLLCLMWFRGAPSPWGRLGWGLYGAPSPWEGTEKVPFFYDQNGKCLRFVTSLSANRLK